MGLASRAHWRLLPVEAEKEEEEEEEADASDLLPLSCGRARRRQRQWHSSFAGFPGDVPLRTVFPSVSGRLVMHDILAGMDQKSFFMFVDTPFRAANADPHGPDYSPDHRDSSVAVRSHVFDAPVVLVVCWLRCASAVFLLVVAGQFGRCGPE